MIEVAEYDSNWPRQFERLWIVYSEAMAAAKVPIRAIEHVGSTAVEGLTAKPVIDCDIVVDERFVGAASAVLVDLGFTARGDLGISSRWAFDEPEHLAHEYLHRGPRFTGTTKPSGRPRCAASKYGPS